MRLIIPLFSKSVANPATKKVFKPSSFFCSPVILRTFFFPLLTKTRLQKSRWQADRGARAALAIAPPPSRTCREPRPGHALRAEATPKARPLSRWRRANVEWAPSRRLSSQTFPRIPQKRLCPQPLPDDTSAGLCPPPGRTARQFPRCPAPECKFVK